MQTHYYLLYLADINTELAEIISAEAFEHGAEGVEENMPFEQSGEFYEPKLLDVESTNLKIFFYSPPSAQFTSWLETKVPAQNIHLSEEANKDWMEEWKKGFEAFELVDGIYVVPSWKSVPDAAKAAIHIDPGMAFGTGTHETTQLASKLMLEVPLKAKNVLDVGTGTGILAFLAEHRGATNIIGIEIEDEARRTARENVIINKSKVIIQDGLIDKVSGHFDLVIANIIDGVLVQIQKDLKDKTSSGGYLLLTGILDERDENFRQRFSFTGWQLLKRSTQKEWVGYLLKKN